MISATPSQQIGGPDISGALAVYTQVNGRSSVFLSCVALVRDRFQPYFDTHDGLRLLGYPLSGETSVGGFPAQYFQKGRVEDQRGVSPNPLFQFQYGLLAAELTEAHAAVPVGGDTSAVTYATVHQKARSALLTPIPAGFSHGIFHEPNGTIFIPLSPLLAAHPGHTVPLVFWTYMNRPDLFPAGWLHDMGLPITEPFLAHVTKFGQARTITVQVFQRTILTSDPPTRLTSRWSGPMSGWIMPRSSLTESRPNRREVSFSSHPAPGTQKCRTEESPVTFRLCFRSTL